MPTGGVPANKSLFTGAVPAKDFLFARQVSANYFSGMVLANNLFLGINGADFPLVLSLFLMKGAPANKVIFSGGPAENNFLGEVS